MWVYLIKNTVNGKGYVGQTTMYPPEKRWTTHKSLSKSNTYSSKLHNAFRKYGIKKFEFTVLNKLPVQTQGALDRYEKIAIKLLNTVELGYNIQPGGRGGSHSEETRQKLRARALGRVKQTHWKPTGVRKHTEEWKENMSSVMSGRVFSESHKEKIGLANQSRVILESSKEKNRKSNVFREYMVTDPSGEVELTESLTNYSKINGVSKSKMCELATGKLTYYRGYAVTILRENTR